MSQWQPIESAPKHFPAMFWVVPGEGFIDTSGNEIKANFAPHIHMGKYGTWSSLSKATHWMSLPTPP